VKAAAAVLGASLLFFLGVLTGVGRRETVPPPTAIPLGAVSTPTEPGTSRPTSPADAPKRSTTTTVAIEPAPTSPPSTAGPTDTTEATATTATSSTTPSTAPPSTTTTTTTRSGEVEQVDNQVDCRSERKEGKGRREPCPSTTTSTGEAPGGGGNG
jgi:hypothetical protein